MNKRRVRAAPVSVYFPDAKQRRALEDAAKRDGRSISNLIQKFIREGVARMNTESASNG